MHNTIRWITGDERVVDVEGDGFMEMFAWETDPGYTVHLLNYTNPNAHHGWMQSVYPLGAQTVSLQATARRPERNRSSCCAPDKACPFTWRTRCCASPSRASGTTKWRPSGPANDAGTVGLRQGRTEKSDRLNGVQKKN